MDEPFDMGLHLNGKTILITGGTGYLGRALTRRLLEHDVHSIRILSRDEVKHHKFQEDFEYNPRIRNLIGDVRDYDRLKTAMQGVDIVIHAAALKRIDMMEYNVQESVKTNVLATLNVVNAALENNVETAIYVSTDKACSPVNTYGACKFVSERVFVESNYNKGKKKTRFACVRYGNVLESTGSVIPFFKKFIQEGKPVPLTDARMTRFVITHYQACNLIFNAIVYSSGGEVFVPQLPALKVVDLIDVMFEADGKKKAVKEVGIRPGEKIHEIMINEAEVPRSYEFQGMYVIASQIQKYKTTDQPVFISKGRSITTKDFVEYSSDSALISKAELKTLLRDINVI